MVSTTAIKASNALINDDTAPRVSVFVGGTSGIGKLTIRALVATGASIRIYIVGRKASYKRTQTFIQELAVLNPNAEIIWLEGEISLLVDVNRMCQAIQSKEHQLDLLFLSAGYAPMSARQETAEGIEITQSLEYYSRMLFTMLLLPLMHQSSAPRVVSVLAGGLERPSMNLDDIDLRKPGNFNMMRARFQNTNLNSIGMDKIACDNPHVTFIHSWPGWVNTGNVWRGIDDRNSWMGWFVWLVLEPLIGLFSMSDEISGQRNLFQCTSAAFGGRGIVWSGKPGVNSTGKQEGGLFLVNYKMDCAQNVGVMTKLRENAMGRVWEHTMEVLGSYL